MSETRPASGEEQQQSLGMRTYDYFACFPGSCLPAIMIDNFASPEQRAAILGLVISVAVQKYSPEEIEAITACAPSLIETLKRMKAGSAGTWDTLEKELPL